MNKRPIAVRKVLLDALACMRHISVEEWTSGLDNQVREDIADALERHYGIDTKELDLERRWQRLKEGTYGNASGEAPAEAGQA
jgi:hypothetical protein